MQGAVFRAATVIFSRLELVAVEATHRGFQAPGSGFTTWPGLKVLPPTQQAKCQSASEMTVASANERVTAKPLVHVDVTSDIVCPWCFIGKKNLEKAIEATKDKYDVEVRWHPFLLNPNAPTEGRDKCEFYREKFGAGRTEAIMERMRELFAERGFEFRAGGKTGSTMDGHRLLELAAQQGLEKQNALAEELFLNYFTQEKYIGDREVLLAAAQKVGVTGAAEWLDDPMAGIPEVREGLIKFAKGVNGVPYFRIGDVAISGAQPAAVFVKAFERSKAI